MSALRRLALAGVVSLCALVGGLVFGSVGALGAVTHDYLSRITTVPATGPAPAEEPVALPGPLGTVHALTLDAGELYVTDDDGQASNYRLDKFNASAGSFLKQFAQVPSLAYLHDGVAVGHAGGEAQVYVGGDAAGSTEGAVAVFGASGGLLGTWMGVDTESGSFGCFECSSREAVTAVDNSGSLGDWAAGDVYVADPQHGVVDVFKPGPGGAEEYITRLTGPEPESFSNPQVVAVDQANGDVLVADGGSVVDVFEPVAGMPGIYQLLFKITQTPAGALSGVYGLAVDGSSGEIYVSQESNSSVEQFSAAGVYLGRLTGTPAGPFTHPQGLAVDPVSHRLYVGDHSEGEGGVVDVFGPDLTIPDAVSEPASSVQPTSVTLNGTVNPNGVTLGDCHFAYGTTGSYGQSVPCAQSPAEIGVGNTPVAVSAHLTGLTAGAVYHFRLSATNANGPNQGQDRVFGAPRIHDVSASGATRTAASLEAQVNPEGVDTVYRFEYGTTSAYGTKVPLPDGDIGAGESDVPLTAELTGLQAGVTYHFRIAAVNAAGTSASEDHTFTTIAPALIDGITITDITSSGASVHANINPLSSDTTYHFEYGTSLSYGKSAPEPDVDIGSGSSAQTVTQRLSGLVANTTYHVRVVAQNAFGAARSEDHVFVYDTNGGGLPDGRAYEMVTPLHKNGALIGDVAFNSPPAASEDGSRVMAASIQCFAGAGSCIGLRGNAGTGYEFSRTSGGWVTTPLAPSASLFPISSADTYDPDTGMSLWSIPAPPGGQDDWFVRKPDGSFVDIGPKTPPSAGEQVAQGRAAQMTADFSHVVWIEVPVWPLFDATPPLAGFSIYEYAGIGNVAPALVGVSGGPGSTDLIGVCGTELGAIDSLSTAGTMSEDGRTVFFTTRACASGSGVNAGVPVPAATLYARIDESRTVTISRHSPSGCLSSACQTSPPADAVFRSASADGSKALFTSTQQLTDSASEGSVNLYEYDFSNPAGHELIDVSQGDTSGAGPGVQGVMALSPDGSHVYFVATGVLSGAANDRGQHAQAGAENLYVFERDASYPAGRLTFIASLPESDSDQWSQVVNLLANVTPDGRFLVFSSRGRLTADDTSVSGAQQVFRYDAQAGVLVRISIGDDGFNDNGNRSAASPCSLANGCSEDASIAFAESSTVPRRSDATMSHDGSYVFFRSPVGLTPRALDDVQIASLESNTPVYAQNVYEWHAGHVYLISDGRDTSMLGGGSPTSMVRLIGSDATGANVFFWTADSLVSQDTDSEVDYYDARICTADDPCIKAPTAPVACQGEGCHGTPAAAPSAVGAATATFSGPGNLAAPPPSLRKTVTKKTAVRCTKGKRLKRGKCVKRHRPKKAGTKGAKSIHGGKK